MKHTFEAKGKQYERGSKFQRDRWGGILNLKFADLLSQFLPPNREDLEQDQTSSFRQRP
jgi:hypothetical protein